MKEKMDKVKEFLKAVVCFAKQTILIGKNIFGKKNKTSVEYRDLAPIDDVSECEEHIKALEWAVASGRVKNIALSGPYGSGKSSIIETFLRCNPLVKEKSLKLSLATFTKEENGALIFSENLEKGILKQLFYKVKQSKIPQSRYRKLHKIEYWPIFWKTILCVLVVLALLFVFWPSTFETGCALILDAGFKIYNGINGADVTTGDRLLKNITFLSFAFLSFLVLAGFVRILQLFVARVSIREIKLPTDTTIGQKDSDGESIFNKNMDEIVYFFETTNYRFVFIEDLDRFKDPEIFIQLRELNTLLNNCETIKEPVIFVYAIRDDMFRGSERTKFFEFIIPVIPIINSTNSGEVLLAMLEQSNKEGVEHDITRGYVLDISPFISDMRILQNIYNEFVLYKATLKIGQKLILYDEQIMSLIVFKNLYPSEFAALQAEAGIVKQAFRNKSQFVEKKRENIQTQIDTKTLVLNNIATDALNSVRELKYAMLCAINEWAGITCKVQFNGGTQYSADTIIADDFDMSNLLQKGQWYVYYATKTGSISNGMFDVPSLCTPYIERYKYLQNAGEKKNKN